MAKNKPGLPDGFELKVHNPVELGDYLDEDYAGNAARVLAAKRAAMPHPQPEPKRIVSDPSPAASIPKPQVLQPVPQQLPATKESVLDFEEAKRRTAPKASLFSRPDRVQFNMRPEMVKMFEDIVEFVQRYSLQPDAKPNEVFDAIVNVLHDAKEGMSFGDVPRRGKWGTPTARAFPTALGNAFAKAIAMRYAKQKSE